MIVYIVYRYSLIITMVGKRVKFGGTQKKAQNIKGHLGPRMASPALFAHLRPQTWLWMALSCFWGGGLSIQQTSRFVRPWSRLFREWKTPQGILVLWWGQMDTLDLSITSHRLQRWQLCCVFSHLVMPNSLWPCGLYSLWNSPGQNPGVGILSLIQGIFPTQGLNPGVPHCRQILYQLSYQGSSKVIAPWTKANLSRVRGVRSSRLEAWKTVASGMPHRGETCAGPDGREHFTSL